MTRAERVTKEIRKHDRLLYCEKFNKADGTGQSPLVIYRELYRFEPMDVDGQIIHFKVPSPHYVFALTDNWSVSGVPVERGLLPIMERLKQMDLWASETESERMLKHNEKVEKGEASDRRNQIEGFVRELRPQFAKATADVNTSLLDKKKDRRYLDDKKIKEN